MNLNDLRIDADSFEKNPDTGRYENVRTYEQKDYSLPGEVLFKNLADALITLIDDADCVLACVAWLTCPRILKALSKKQCSIVVNKEDFLRPDGASSQAPLRDSYDRLRGLAEDIWGAPGIAPELSSGSSHELSAVRCMGERGSRTTPRMHHKFAVFCQILDHPKYVFNDEGWAAPNNVDGWGRYIKPYAVWTGSFNWTWNGSQSLENAVILRDPKIASAYAEEWAQVLALSEPLDWSSKYAEPDLRIGT